MTIQRTRVGKGFSARTVLGSETGQMSRSDFFDTLREHQRAKRWTLDGRLHEIEQRAAELCGDSEGDEFGRPKADYAREALAYVELIRAELAGAGQHAEAASLAALNLGSLWRELELKPFERTATASSRGGKAAAAAKWPGESTKEMRARIQKEFQGADLRSIGGKMRAYQLLADKYGVSPRTIRRRLKGN